MSLADVLLLLAAGFAGGMVNAIAGGATFFTFPAMLAVGIPPVTANASNTVALCPASLVAAWAQRRDLADLGRHLVPLSAIGVLGGAIGAVSLLLTSDRAFMVLVPFLLLGATLLFALSPRLLALIRARQAHDGRFRASPPTMAVTAVASAYGGFFGAGLGILLLATLSLAGLDRLSTANAVKNLLSSAVYLVAVVIFVVSDAVVWWATLVMLAGALLGGYAGARLARRLPQRVFRAIVIGVGSLLTVWYFVKL